MSLEIEYKQWLFITTELYGFIYQELLSQRSNSHQEGRNIFQHWLLAVNQDETLPKFKFFPLFPEIEIGDNERQITNKCALLLVNAIEEKNFFKYQNRSHSMDAVRNILNFIHSHHNAYNFEELSLTPLVVNGLIRLEQFQSKNFVNLPLLLKKFDVVNVTKMILRYESIGNGSYQWGDPKELHMCYYNDYNVRYEGFASPFNSRFIGLSDCRFCSLFPDTDAVFGSLGNFFNVDLLKYPGSWSVNPPFINDVMERVSMKIIQALKSGVKSIFFCTYPYWKDSEGWKMLEKSKYLVESFHRERDIVIQDAYGHVFAPHNGLSLFCVSSFMQLNLNNVADILNKGLEDFDTSFNELSRKSPN